MAAAVPEDFPIDAIGNRCGVWHDHEYRAIGFHYPPDLLKSRPELSEMFNAMVESHRVESPRTEGKTNGVSLDERCI